MILPSVIRPKQTLLLILWLFCGGFVVAQTDTSALTHVPRLKRNIRANPSLLVAALTADKTTDEEKFEAIFAWVATNIKYDYKQYFSGKGASSETEILRILKKSAISQS